MKNNTTNTDFEKSVAQTMSFGLASRNKNPSNLPLYILIVNPQHWHIGKILNDGEECRLECFIIEENGNVNVINLLNFLGYLENRVGLNY